MSTDVSAPASRIPLEVTRRARRVAYLVGGVAFATLLLWVPIGHLLGSERGLELTDEGLYLLAADPPSAQAAWGFPFGWHTGPLFRLVGYDIASFRTAGGVVLVLAAATLAWNVFVTVTPTVSRGPWRRTAYWATAAISVSIGGTGALLYYAAMLRTPSYNWLNLVGIMVATAGLLGLVRSHNQATPKLGTYLAPIAVSSAALFLTFPAKPSTFPLMLALGGLVAWTLIGRRAALTWTFGTILLVPVWIALAVLLRAWPTDFASVFLLALRMPLPSEYHTVSAAAEAVALIPRDFLSGLSGTSDSLFLLLLLAFICLLVPVALGRFMGPIRLLGIAIAGVVGIGVSGVPLPLIEVDVQTYRLAYAPLTTACIILFGSALASLSRTGAPTTSDASSTRIRSIVILALALLPFIFAFGSDNGVYAQASLAVGLLLLAAISWTMARTEDWFIWCIRVIIAGFTAVVVAAAIYSGWKAPYRTVSLWDQNVKTSVGSHSAQLLLDASSFEGLSQLRSQAESMGWRDGAPIIDVSYPWHPGIPYFLGGRVPNFLQLTIFGYATTHDITAYHLGPAYTDFPFGAAWILVSDPLTLTEDEQRAVRFTTDQLQPLSGMSFPSQYQCARGAAFLLGIPAAGPSGGDACE